MPSCCEKANNVLGCTNKRTACKAQELILVLSLMLIRPELDFLDLPCSSLDVEVEEKKWTSQKDQGKLSKNYRGSRKPGLQGKGCNRACLV